MHAPLSIKLNTFKFGEPLNVGYTDILSNFVHIQLQGAQLKSTLFNMIANVLRRK